MNKIFLTFISILTFSSCSMIGGPDGLFPEKKYDFLKEEIADEIETPETLTKPNTEDHFPAYKPDFIEQNQDIPKPRQIFASSGDTTVQLRRLGELMWIYAETLPSTSWPISKNYWDTSIYQVKEANPNTGEIVVEFDEATDLVMKIEHGIKESSSEIFLYQVNKVDNNIVANQELLQLEMEKIVNYFAESIGSFSGTSLAAQGLNELKKTKIFTENGKTVISLELSFDRAWSSVSKALQSANIVTNDRDRSSGKFFVSYAEDQQRGLFGIFGGGNKENNDQIEFSDEYEFEIIITQEKNKTYVRAISKNGNIENSEELLSKINESLS
tara:strand:+ start:77200 stop:78183 length:984 start_codon:yes stop_codon:yes gene_type:complete